MVALSYDSCSTMNFDAKTLAAINFKISDGAPPTLASFFTHSDSGGQFSCGPRQYRLVTTYAGLTFEGKSGLGYKDVLKLNDLGYNSADELKFAFSTTDPSAVGTHLIEVLVETVNYPQFNARLFHID